MLAQEITSLKIATEAFEQRLNSLESNFREWKTSLDNKINVLENKVVNLQTDIYEFKDLLIVMKKDHENMISDLTKCL